VQLGSVVAAVGLGGDHGDHLVLKACQWGRVGHEPGELLSKRDTDIGADREKSTHVGHELGIGFGSADSPVCHLSVPDLTLLV